MNLKTASTFLFVTAIISITFDVSRFLFQAMHFGTGIIAQLITIFFLLTILTDVIFMLLAISYRKLLLNNVAIKRIGLFMAITGGAVLLAEAGEMVTVGSLTRWLNPYIEQFVHVFGAVAMVVFGTALAGNNERYTRNALWIFISSIGCSALNLMYVTGVIVTGNYNMLTKVIHALSSLVPLVFLTAQLFWALAVLKNLKRPDTEKPIDDFKRQLK